MRTICSFRNPQRGIVLCVRGHDVKVIVLARGAVEKRKSFSALEDEYHPLTVS